MTNSFCSDPFRDVLTTASLSTIATNVLITTERGTQISGYSFHPRWESIKRTHWWSRFKKKNNNPTASLWLGGRESSVLSTDVHFFFHQGFYSRKTRKRLTLRSNSELGCQKYAYSAKSSPTKHFWSRVPLLEQTSKANKHNEWRRGSS